MAGIDLIDHAEVFGEVVASLPCCLTALIYIDLLRISIKMHFYAADG